MLIARVVGSAVSTAKDQRLHGSKLLVVQPATVTDERTGEPFIAVDTVGAGEGELVIVVRGSAARQTDHTADVPTDAAIVGILDSLEVDRDVSYRKS
jgi:ethanolamine utilization protein EutN